MARIDIEDLDEDREIKKEEMEKAFGGFGFSLGTSFSSSNRQGTSMPGTNWHGRRGGQGSLPAGVNRGDMEVGKTLTIPE